MTTTSLTTAVLIFAASGEYDSGRKNIGQSASFFDQLTADTIELVEHSGMPYYVSTEKNQIGKSFGKRYCNAIQSLFDQGYDNVISIGNDSPGLTLQSLLDAKILLDQNKSVVGPSTDGGFYLLGTHRSTFREIKSRLLGLDWNTSRVQSQVKFLLDHCSPPAIFIDKLADLDHQRDARCFLNHAALFSSTAYQLLLILCKNLTQHSILECETVTNLYFNTFHNKGSPVQRFNA